jgi:hypothetical protein
MIFRPRSENVSRCFLRGRRNIRTGIKTLQKLTELKLFTEDAAKAVAENTANIARYCQDNTNIPSYGSWTDTQLVEELRKAAE